MEKDRSRGIKHIKDKQKYKGISTKNEKYIAPKNKPLDSNWDRYETETANNEHELSSSTDFELLANVPVSSGSFYESKTNQVIEEEIQKQNSSSNLFCLDLDMLQRSVATVPFYDTIEIDKKYFTDQEISEFDHEAAQNLEKLNDFLKTLAPVKSKLKSDNFSSNNKSKDISGIPKINNPTEKLQEILSDAEPQKILTQNSESPIKDSDEISELINNIELEEKEPDNEIKNVKKVKKGNEDLEQWLDDILDD